MKPANLITGKSAGFGLANLIACGRAHPHQQLSAGYPPMTNDEYLDDSPEPAAETIRSPRLITITLHEAAVGKPRMTRRDKWKQRPSVVSYRAWCDRLRAAAGKLPPADKVLSLSWEASFAVPKSWSKRKRIAAIGTLHRNKPDRDNIDKAILDTLYPERDQAIAVGTIEKYWGWRSTLEIRIKVEA